MLTAEINGEKYMNINALMITYLMIGLAVSSPLFGSSEHQNVIEIDSDNDPEVNSLVYYWDGGYSITSGQPWDGVTTNNVSTDLLPAYQVDALAGRHSSGPPADFFNDRANGLFTTTNGNKDTPDGMNFAYTGVLEINGYDYKIVIGQNGCGTDNCWYLAPNESGFRNWDYNEIMTPDQRFYIRASGSNTFAVGAYCSGDCPGPGN